MPGLRLAVLISGAGSTMVNLAREIEAGRLPAEIAIVVASRRGAPGLARAHELGLATAVLSRKGFEGPAGFDASAYSRALAALVAPFDPGLIVLAGFMTRLAAPVFARFDVINVHPALLPAFGGDGCFGHHVHEAVLAAGVKLSGATVHFSDETYDTGPIILQEAVPVLDDDTPDSLAARVQDAERRIYPAAIRLYAEGRLRREGRRVRILPSGSST